MKLSDVLVFMYALATDAPGFQEVKGSEELKMYKQLYKEVLAAEAEGKDFNEQE